VAVASALAVAVLGALAAIALRRFASHGQLDADRWDIFLEAAIWRFLGVGLLNTLKVAGLAMALAVPFGALLALGRLARNGPVRWVTGAYVELFRAFPLLLLILYSGFVLRNQGLELATIWYLVGALVAYNGAVLGEIFRAGILSLERGQTEAAYSIGLSYWQAMRTVVIPQAARRMVPAVVSQMVTLLKDSSLGFIIAYEELLRRGRIVGAFTNDTLQPLIVVALIYILVNLALSQLARRLEVRQRRRYRAGAIQVGGLEDLAVLGAQAGVGPGAREAPAARW
ncbi:MAG: amino acid ABC transporter permease, partial [Acidimicrobiales bacterium]